MRWPWSTHRDEVDPADVLAVIERNVRLARDLDETRRGRLVDLTAELVATKRWEALAGHTVTDEMRITIAANAAIPILELDIATYRHVQAIVVRPGPTASNSQRTGRVGGTYSDHPMWTSGEAFPNSGPVAISWSSAKYESRHPASGRNVVIHEFAHKIDMSDGYTDGIPPLSGDDLDRWVEVLADEFDHTEDRPDDEVLDPYAWTNKAEFFAVATETFFCRSVPLREAKPVLYRAMAAFFRQDPAADRSASGSY